jgi:hypothetical protein
LIRDLDHIGLLADERVYRSLRTWLGERSGSATRDHLA